MSMRRRLERAKMFRNQSLRQYEMFVWRVYTRPSCVLARDLPFFLKRQVE